MCVNALDTVFRLQKKFKRKITQNTKKKQTKNGQEKKMRKKTFYLEYPGYI